MEEPEARARGKSVIASEEDGYAHGGAHLVVEDRSDQVVRLLDLVEDVNDAVALFDLASNRVEEQDDAMGGRCIRIERRAQIIRHPGQDWSRPFDIERAVLLVEFERGAGGCLLVV
jgi:hypothetical protein